ncbi:MAG: hypothetical protein SGJ11_03590 [Phycisphaerae bacterium]|nr:hypothetical protein [Phycisphaerae bacterium]
MARDTEALRWLGWSFVAVGLVAAPCGCSQARQRIEKAQSIYAAGDPAGAHALLADTGATGLRSETRDALLWRMEEGKTAQDAGKFEESWTVLTEASLLSDRFDLEWSTTTLPEELGAITVNDRLRTFRGSYADRIAIENARIIAALSRHDGSGAAVAARRAIERQRDAEIEQEKRIAKIDDEISKRGGGDAVQAILGREGVDLTVAYTAYLNPLASWLSGMLQSSTGDGNDRQRGDTDLRRALAMMPENKTLLAQVEHNPFDRARDGAPQVMVLFENGMAPRLEQITIPLITPWLGLSTIPLPKQVRNPRPAYAVDVRGGDSVVRTETLADYDAIWERDFQQRLPEIILRTAVMVAAKEAATFAASEPLRRRGRDGDSGAALGQIAVLIAASAYKYVTNQSDLRTWRSVPAEVQIAQLPRPADGIVEVGVAGGPMTRVALPDAPVTLVWVRSAVPGQLLIRAVPLQSGGTAPGPAADCPPEHTVSRPLTFGASS